MQPGASLYVWIQVQVYRKGFQRSPPFRVQPGAGGTRRRSPPTVNVGKYSLQCIESGIEAFIHQSKWNTCGWTFQEALVARRCLFFTTEQVFFSCSEITGRESVHPPYLRPTLLTKQSVLRLLATVWRVILASRHLSCNIFVLIDGVF